MKTIALFAVLAVLLLVPAVASANPIAVSCGGGFVQQSSYSSVQVLSAPQVYYAPQAVQVLAAPVCYSQVQVLAVPVVKQQRVRQRVLVEQRQRVRSRSFSFSRTRAR